VPTKQWKGLIFDVDFCGLTLREVDGPAADDTVSTRINNGAGSEL
jgi:hypothetical protein